MRRLQVKQAFSVLGVTLLVFARALPLSTHNPQSIIAGHFTNVGLISASYFLFLIH